MQQFSLLYNNLFVFLEPVDELRPTYVRGQFMQGSSIVQLEAANVVMACNLWGNQWRNSRVSIFGVTIWQWLQPVSQVK